MAAFAAAFSMLDFTRVSLGLMIFLATATLRVFFAFPIIYSFLAKRGKCRLRGTKERGAKFIRYAITRGNDEQT